MIGIAHMAGERQDQVCAGRVSEEDDILGVESEVVDQVRPAGDDVEELGGPGGVVGEAVVEAEYALG